MIVFHTLTLRNFMSYGNNTTVVDLSQPGSTLITGEDLDNTGSGVAANGVGKSAIINALTYALYDKPISKVNLDKLVNDINQKNMVVTIEFTVDGVPYKIHRERKTKAGAAGNNVYFYENGKDKTIDSPGTNKLIETVIGMPYEVFVRIVVFSASNTAFLNLPVKHATQVSQTSIMEELFELTDVSERAETLKQAIKDAETSMSLHKVKVEQLEKEHARYATQVESAEKRVKAWQQQTDATVAELCAKLARIERVDFDAEQVTHNSIKAVKHTLEQGEAAIKSNKRELKDALAKQTQYTNELKHLKDAKCPYCLQDFADTQKKIENIEVKLVELDELVLRVSEAIEAQEATNASNNQSLEELQGKLTVANLEELLKIRNDADNIRQRILDLDEAVNPHVETLEELKASPPEPIDYDEVNRVTKLVDHQKFLLKLLTKSDSFVRKSLINRNLPFLNAKLREYLLDLGLPHQVEFDQEMIAQISRFGVSKDIDQLSQGQRARIQLAIAWAFRDVRERRNKKINVCLYDEVLDIGLDAVGVQAAAKALKRKARDENLSMFVISHRDGIDNMFERKLTIQMSKGFSYIKDSNV